MSMNADQTHTIRLPIGAGAKLKAATGLPLSTIVRFIVMEMLAKYEAEGTQGVKAKIQSDVQAAVEQASGGPMQTSLGANDVSRE